MIIILLLGGVLFALLFAFLVCLWVYKDSVARGDKQKFLWPVIVFFTSPILGLIIYLICRKEEQKPCGSCQKPIKKTAIYCEYCGVKNNAGDTFIGLGPKKHLKILMSGCVCLLLMIGCFASFATIAITSDNFQNTFGSALESFPNLRMSVGIKNIKIGDKWDFSLLYAHGYQESRRYHIKEDSTMLWIDIEASEGSILLHLTQRGGLSETIDVSQLTEPLEYSLENFETGRITATLEIDEARDIRGLIMLK